MKNKSLQAWVLSVLFLSSAIVSCSSGDGSMDEPSGGSSSGTTSGSIPENTDSGNNNNSAPDNIKPDNTGNGGDTESGNEWQLRFEDNFDTNDSIPDTQYWTLTPRGTDTWNRHMSESYAQAYQKDGYLYLFGMLVNGEYLTGGIETRNKFDFTYGQVKCRARFLRHPQGNHTGIWMMPEPPAEKWPRSGEIDIMEHLDSEDLVYETVHYYDTATQENASSHATAEIDQEDFNVYGIIWDKENVTFTLNGESVFSYKNNNPEDSEFSYQYPFTKPFYLILSQSLGGKGTWEGEINNEQLPAIFQIDWIKVWQKTEN